MPSRSKYAHALRVLAMDAVQQAKSGHPGMPMGMADIAEVLWRDFLVFNPNNSAWLNRDRFILSNGHGVMLHYALLHLTGFDLSLDDLKQFRQWGSKTPGHPERGVTPGIETTTGPLGQGLANAVGMAIAERALAQTFNRDHYAIVDHFTYAFVGDGDLMEGLSYEACSLAGTLKLGKLIVFYDDNGISIDGDVQGWFTEDTPKRFEACGWHVVADVNGHDPDAIQSAIEEARAVSDRPSMIACKTIIGYGAAPALAGHAVVHGAPLGLEEVARVRIALNWPHPPFEIPDEIYAAWDKRASGEGREQAWQSLFDEYRAAYPDLAAEFLRRQARCLPEAWEEMTQQLIEERQDNKQSLATRKHSWQCLNALSQLLPELVGGSADLSESNGTLWTGAQVLSAVNPSGNYIEYGVREFAMSAIMNGMAIHGGFIPFGGTFLTFSDYARPALRLAAIMQAHVIFLYSHDSIGVGEDGPTHQPVEQMAALRLMPGLLIWRPCDGAETAVMWQQALSHQQPHVVVLTRQSVKQQVRTTTQLAAIAKGGYILWESERGCDAIIIATGSEVSLAIDAAIRLEQISRFVRVVSMPCCERFKAQSSAYREAVLPSTIKKRVAIEAGVPDSWYPWVGEAGKVMGLDHFGESAPGDKVMAACGFTVEQVMQTVSDFFL